jgi:tetratricopeptide (TPR) repeat protein
MRRIILFVVLLGMIVPVMALNPDTLIKSANSDYKQSKFDEAIKKYLNVVSSGYVSAELYFNIGNAYFKRHDFKSAILYYERAKLLNPADKDIDFNLDLTRNFTVDKIETMPEVFFISWIKWVRNLMSVNNWTIVGAITFLLTLISFLWYLLSGKVNLKKIGFWIGVVSFIISIASISMSYQLKYLQEAKNTAIIFTPSVTLKSSPDDSGTNLFILHEGTKVEILDKVGDWRWVKIADGNRGWIKISDMVTI